jgi:hypothetical protein
MSEDCEADPRGEPKDSTGDADTLGFTRAFDPKEREARARLARLLRESPLPAGELGDNLGLYQDHIGLGKALFLDHLYRLILPRPGVILELGCRWGQNLATFSNLRALYEPTNHLRKIVGFDTFQGFVAVDPEDGESPFARVGNLATGEEYPTHLREVLAANELSKPLAHKRKHEVVVGDARETLPAWLAARPQTIVALAYLDMDLYDPTRAALEALAPHLTKGSVVVFDELNDDGFPGETLALREVLGLPSVRLHRVPYLTYPSYLVVE